LGKELKTYLKCKSWWWSSQVFIVAYTMKLSQIKILIVHEITMSACLDENIDEKWTYVNKNQKAPTSNKSPNCTTR
jgi:hypothetical protein